ncbi:DMT family transporter [Sphingobacterium sp. Mn56C]|uniref:DMT family transporter n=1 Tax=Sphingobacterium sp. Mn56C TaxID=3395261 RepID=UPI003BCD5D6D
MKKSYFLLHLAVVLAGFTGIFGKLIVLNPFVLSVYRVFLSAIFLKILLLASGKKYALSYKERHEIGKGGFLIGLSWILFYASIYSSGISIAVLCYGLMGFFTALFKPFFVSARIHIKELLLSSLSVLGIAIIFHFNIQNKLGIILGVVSAALASIYTLINEKLIVKYPSLLINYLQMRYASICLGLLWLVFVFFYPMENILPSYSDMFYLILLSLFCTVLLYVLVADVLRQLSAFTVNLTFNLEPLYAIILAIVLFKEGRLLDIYFFIGLVIVSLSLVLQVIFSWNKKNRQMQ